MAQSILRKVAFMLPSERLELREYTDERGSSPFGVWFDSLNAVAAARVTISLVRLETGNTSTLKSVGEGVLECRINFGPGYRVYLGRDGSRLVILLAGGTKQRQQADISAAKLRWQDYKVRSREEK